MFLVQDFSSNNLCFLCFLNSSHIFWGTARKNYWYWHTVKFFSRVNVLLVDAVSIEHLGWHVLFKCYCRWFFDCSSYSSINSNMWHYPFNLWRTAAAHSRGSWTNSSNVHIYVQLCQGEERIGTQTLLGVDSLVILKNQLYKTWEKLCLILCKCQLFVILHAGFVYGQPFCFSCWPYWEHAPLSIDLHA